MVLFPAAAPASATLALTLPLRSLAIAVTALAAVTVASLAITVAAKTHRANMVVHPATRPAATAATGTRSARPIAVVVQGLDGEFGKGARHRDGAFELGERGAYQGPTDWAVFAIVKNSRKSVGR